MKRIIVCFMLIGVLLCMIAPFASAASDLKYWIGVDVVNQRTTVYRVSDNEVVHRFICSTGLKSGYTPLGTFKMPKPRSSTDRKEWYYLSKYRCWVKYASRIRGPILFHSLPFNSQNNSDLDPEAVAKLGKPASHGCVRLKVPAAQWIARNCPEGTMVVIHKGANDSRIKKILGESAGTQLTKEFDAAPEITGLKLNVEPSITLNLGDSLQLKCAVQPSAAADKAVLKWSSSEKKVATVSSSGRVTALKEGTATIMVKSFNASKAMVKVKVVDPTKALRVVLDQEDTVKLPLGATLQLHAALQPSTAINTLKWTSSKQKCAAVDAQGCVTALAEGTATITVRTDNKKTDTVKVKVYDPNKPAKVVLAEEGTLTVPLGTTLQLNAAVYNAEGKQLDPDQPLVWSSASKKIAAVDVHGVVTPLRVGTATIAVKTHTGKSDTVKVKVVDLTVATQISIDQGDRIKVALGDSLQLTASLYPETAVTKFKWISGSTKYAEIDPSTGEVTLLRTGKVKLYVRTANGKEDKILLEIVKPQATPVPPVTPTPTETPEPTETLEPETDER